MKYLKLLGLENRFASHQGNHYALLLQPNLRRISLHNLPHPPKKLLANRWDLHKSAPFTKGALFLLGRFPADFFKISVGSIEKVLSS